MIPSFALFGFEFERELGAGGFGTVSLFRKKGGSAKEYAIKHVCFQNIKGEILRSGLLIKAEEAMAKAEILMKRELDIHFLLEQLERQRQTEAWPFPFFYFASIDTNTKKDYLFAMEFCEKGSLFDRLQKHIAKKTTMAENEILRIFYALIKAIKILHDLSIAHRDISSRNIMFNQNDEPKLIDFGAGRIIIEKQIPPSMIVGNPFYLPPEADIPGFQYTDEIMMAGDIWEAGILVCEMIDSPLTRLKSFQIQQKNYTSFASAPFSKQLKELIPKLCQIDPLLRPKADSILSLDIFKDYRVRFEKKDSLVKDAEIPQ